MRNILYIQSTSISIHLSCWARWKNVRGVRQNKDPEMFAKVKGHTKEGAARYVRLGDQNSHAIIMGG